MILHVSVSTPNADGDLIHEVKAGQTLWQIAISYDTTIDEIKRLNNLPDNNIYPGSKLLIGKNVLMTATALTEIVTVEATSSPPMELLPTKALSTPPFTATPSNQPASVSTNTVMRVVMGIIAFAVLGGGLVAWLGNTKK